MLNKWKQVIQREINLIILKLYIQIKQAKSLKMQVPNQQNMENFSIKLQQKILKINKINKMKNIKKIN